jgi:hypothetical protein
MKTLFTIMAYCYIGRWLYLEACLLMPDLAPYLQSTLESLDPPTHDLIAEMVKSYSIPEIMDRGIENLTPKHARAKPNTTDEAQQAMFSEEVPDGYF